MKTAILILVVAALGVVACRRSGGAPASPPLNTPYVKIWVSKTGQIDVDGTPRELSAIGPMLAALSQRKGAVLYGRDDAGEEPHPNAMQVIQLVIANQLPIRMSTRSDFSDAVGPDGRVKE
jgi:hypothetical protein